MTLDELRLRIEAAFPGTEVEEIDPEYLLAVVPKAPNPITGSAPLKFVAGLREGGRLWASWFSLPGVTDSGMDLANRTLVGLLTELTAQHLIATKRRTTAF